MELVRSRLSDLRRPLEPAQPDAPADAAQLRNWIARIGPDHLVVSREELHPGITAYAAPFRGPTGTWDGALYVQGPSFRFPRDRGDDGDRNVRELLLAHAAAVSERLEVH